MSTNKKQRFSFAPLLLVVAAGVISGCSSSSNSGDGSDAKTTINGQAIAGAVDGLVTVSNADGTQLASGVVTAGAFQVEIPNSALVGELDFEVTGQYRDEVSTNTVNVDANPLGLRTPAGHFQAGQAGNAPVTPGSSVVRNLVNTHGKTLAAAGDLFEDALGYQPDLGAKPFDPSAAAPAEASGADNNAAFRAGLFSQLANDLGLSGDNLAALPTALAQDLSDGALDGMDETGNPVSVAGLNLQTLHAAKPLPFRALEAYSSFAGSDKNAASLSTPDGKMPAVTYDLPGSVKRVTVGSRGVDVKLETTAALPFMPGFWTARVAHKVTLTDAATGLPIDVTSDAEIVDVSQYPFMKMLSGHNHSSPHGHMADKSDAVNGNYIMDTYYVMGSEMMGMSRPMGSWEYAVNLGQDTDADGEADQTIKVRFHPKVMMPMADVLVSTVSNAADQWTGMMGAGPRPYRVWLHEVSASGADHDVTVFATTSDMSMPMGGMDMGGGHGSMSFPAVYTGQTLGMNPGVTLNAVVVEMSADGSNWVTADAITAMGGTGTGRYQAAVTGLNTAAQGTLHVRLTVNGNVMTTAAGDNSELKFTAPDL